MLKICPAVPIYTGWMQAFSQAKRTMMLIR